LQAEIASGVGLAVGGRNRGDKSLPTGFCCGQHVFVCDNLAFSSDIVINRRQSPGAHAKANDSFRAASTRSINASGK
jgi:hypothetical protein